MSDYFRASICSCFGNGGQCWHRSEIRSLLVAVPAAVAVAAVVLVVIVVVVVAGLVLIFERNIKGS